MNPSTRFWNRIARKYSRKAVPNPEAYEKKLLLTREHLTKESHVLEFGCGTGSTALLHAPYVASILATDYSDAMIEIAKEKSQSQQVGNVEFSAATLEQVPERPEGYDAVLGLNVLHLMDDWPSAIERSYRLLCPGGVFVTSTACLKEMPKILSLILPLGGRLGVIPRVAFMSIRELEDQMKAVGFDLVSTESPGGDSSGRFIIARRPA